MVRERSPHRCKRFWQGVFLVSVLGPFCGPVVSQEAAPGAVDRLQELERQRQEELRDQRRARQREHTSIPIELPALPESTAEDQEDADCFQIERVAVSGVSVFKDSQVEAWAEPYHGRCLTRSVINQLIRTITQEYIQSGYVTSRAYLPNQDLSDGVFDVQVVEGVVEDIRVIGAPERIARTAFPGLTGEVLNLRDVEQGLDQINRLAGSRATVDFSPGSRVGGTVLVLDVKQDSRVRTDFGINNSGQESTGRQQGLINVSVNNVAGWNEYVNLNLQRSIDSNRAEQFSQSLGFYLAVPYGHWLVSLGGNDFEYAALVEGAARSFISSGDSRSRRLSLERNVFRNQVSKASAELLLKQQKNNNYLEDVLLQSSSFRYEAAELSLSFERYLQNGATALMAVSYTRGLNNNLDDEMAGFYKEDFEKLTINTSYMAPLRALGERAQWTSRFSAQYSEDDLYSAESMTLGSRYTVRGFDRDGVSGARGAYWRNEFSQTYFPSPRYPEYWLIPYAAIDIGRVRGSDTLAGSTLGLRAGGRYLNAEVFYSEPLKAPGRFSHGENRDLGFSFTMTASW